MAETLTKGTRVIVRGRLSQNTYEGRDGVERTSVELRAEDVAVSLRWATGQITRKRREGGQGGGGYGAPQGGGGYGAPQGGGYGAPQGGRGGGYGQGNTGYGAPQGGRNDDPWASQGGSSAYSDDAPF